MFTEAHEWIVQCEEILVQCVEIITVDKWAEEVEFLEWVKRKKLEVQ